MRVTNKMLSDNFLRDMRTNLSNLSNIQGQMSSNKEIRKPSDDPAKASKIMRINSDISANTQYNTNIKDTSNWLDLTDTALSHLSDSIGKIEGLLQSSTGTYTSDELTAVKDVINQQVAAISQTLNGSFDGKYLFGGTNATTKPVDTKVVGGNTELITKLNPKNVADLTAGTMTSTSSLKTNMNGVTFGKDKLTVDGQEVEIDWSTLLTTAQQAQINSDLSGATPATLSSVKDILVSAINTAIDNSGKDVSHVTGSLDSNNNMVLKSGDVGTTSQIKLTSVGSSTSIGAKILSDSTGTVSTTENVGTSIYNGTTEVATDAFNISIGGKNIPVTTNPPIAKGSIMIDAATVLQNNINSAITTENANAGKISGQSGYIEQATVTTTADGKFEISSLTGTVTAFDNNGKTTAKDLGISVALKDNLTVEISQGVTMDYNVTAAQAINYGTGDNNLMKLLSNITSHLDSTSSTVKSKLTNEDLTGIQAAMTNILSLRSEVGAKQNSMTSAESRNDDQNDSMTEILSTTQDIDITQKAMEYATMQNVYTASLQTSAKVLQPTLLDYLR